MHRRTRLAAYGLAALVVGYGLLLLLVGQVWTLYAETPNGGAELGTEFRPVIAGLIPVVGGAVLFVGLARNLRPVIWWGWFMIAAFSVLYMFGVGFLLLPVAAILLGLLVRDSQPFEDRHPE
jgi:hypothetical protein